MKKKISRRRSSGKKADRSPKKAIYRINNWSAYNRALIQRGSLRVWLPDEVISGWYYEGPRQRGAQWVYSDRAIEMALTFRKLYDLPLRQTQGCVGSLFELMRIDLEVPDYSTLWRRQAGLEVSLAVRSKEEPIHLVVDSTGLKLYGEGEWKGRQHGWIKRRTWRKRHLGIDADTGEIVAQTLTRASTDEASPLQPRLEQIPSEVASCAGDGCL